VYAWITGIMSEKFSIDKETHGQQFDFHKNEHEISPPILDTSHIERHWLDIPYANQSDAQKLDIYLPIDGDGPFPVIIYIHGGAWQMGDKRELQILPVLRGVVHGYAVVSINYRSSHEAIFPVQIFDVKSALRFIKANAERYMLDKHRVAAWGASAGGHLAALLGTSAGVAALEDLSTGYPEEDTTVLAVVDWYGPTQDFLQMDAQLIETKYGVSDHSEVDSPESQLLGQEITLIPEPVKKASPMAYITPDIPHFLIQHGYHDQIVPVQQSIKFSAEIERIAGKDKVTLDVFMKDVYHGDPHFENPQNLNKVFEFLDQHLKA
jgi:acetyl esterase/lipase